MASGHVSAVLGVEGTAPWTVNERGVQLREGLSLRTAVVGRLGPGVRCAVAEERATGATPRVHVVWPLDGWATPRLRDGRVLLSCDGRDGSRCERTSAFFAEELRAQHAKMEPVHARTPARTHARTHVPNT